MSVYKGNPGHVTHGFSSTLTIRGIDQTWTLMTLAKSHSSIRCGIVSL